MQKIHVSRNGKVEGPYSLEVIREKILAKELSSADKAWWIGQKNWTSIKDLPGLQFPSEDTPMDTEAQQPPEPIPCFEESDHTQHLSRERTSSVDTSAPPRTDETARTPGITIPDFRVKYSLWISAGWYWVKSLNLNGFLINFVAFLTFLILFISGCVAETYSSFAGSCFVIFIPAVMAPWSWIIMEQFRHHPVKMKDLFSAYLKAPLSLIGLGLILQLPNFFIDFISFDNAIFSSIIRLIVSLIGLFLFFSLFFSGQLLVDKRISLLDSFVSSYKAVNFKFNSMLLYFILIGLIFLSGLFLAALPIFALDPIESIGLPTLLFFIVCGIFGIYSCVLLLFSILALYTSISFAYLWVFSRDTLPPPDSSLQRREPVDQ